MAGSASASSGPPPDRGAWAWWWAGQLVQACAWLAGLLVLAPACLLRAWEPSPYPSIKDGRAIDRWRWRWLWWADNPEDGVSGAQAVLIGGGAYRPTTWAPLRAYFWSACRNSADALKYLFGWPLPGAPYATGRVAGFAYSAGFKVENGRSVAVADLKR